jgi:rhodanese-related sulfurtransferase
MPDTPLEIAPAEVKARLDAGEALRLLDVREPEEHAICRIDGARLLPMRSIPQQWRELDDAASPLIVLCHHGVRSLAVVEWLRARGIEDCLSMSGGIDLWSLTVDPAVPRY